VFLRVYLSEQKLTESRDSKWTVNDQRDTALSTPVLGYVLFAGMRIDIHAEKLCHQQKPGRDRVLGALSISTLNVEETQTRRSPSNPL
jgi:hypothetical protein